MLTPTEQADAELRRIINYYATKHHLAKHTLRDMVERHCGEAEETQELRAKASLFIAATQGHFSVRSKAGQSRADLQLANRKSVARAEGLQC